MDSQSKMLKTQILENDKEIVGFYQKLQEEKNETERKTLVRDILLQKEMNEMLMQNTFTS